MTEPFELHASSSQANTPSSSTPPMIITILQRLAFDKAPSREWNKNELRVLTIKTGAHEEGLGFTNPERGETIKCQLRRVVSTGKNDR